MNPVRPRLGRSVRRVCVLLYFALFVLGLSACQSSPPPATLGVKGGTVTATHTEWTGYGLIVDPSPPPVEDKKPRQVTPWILILDPLPQDPAKIPAVLNAPVAPLPESPK